MKRRGQLSLRGLETGGERTGKKALHIGRAAPVKPAITARHGEWWNGPVLSIDGDYVGVAGENHAGYADRANSRKKIGFAAIFARDDVALDAPFPKCLDDIAYKVEVRVAADGAKSN